MIFVVKCGVRRLKVVCGVVSRQGVGVWGVQGDSARSHLIRRQNIVLLL